MTPLTSLYYIYILIYKDKQKKTSYIGITNGLSRRFIEHIKGKVRTTNRFNKSYKLDEIRFNFIGSKELAKLKEKRMKHYSLKKKLIVSENWNRRRVG